MALAPILTILAILLLCVLVRFAVFRRLARDARSAARPRARDAIAGARGRTVIVGEHHADRDGLATALSLIREAHAAGYRTLGVEVCRESRDRCSGLDDELRALEGMPSDETLAENDERSSLDPSADGLRPRMNRQWQIRAALALGWEIVPFDPHHWNWMREDEDGYLRSREQAMADEIRRHGPMLAFCGYGHLAGLHALLGDECAYAVCSPVRESDVDGTAFWMPRIRFAATLPFLAP